MFGNLPQNAPISLWNQRTTPLRVTARSFHSLNPAAPSGLPRFQQSLDGRTELLAVPQTADCRPLESFHQLSPLLGMTFPCIKTRLSLYFFQEAAATSSVYQDSSVLCPIMSCVCPSGQHLLLFWIFPALRPLLSLYNALAHITCLIFLLVFSVHRQAQKEPQHTHRDLIPELGTVYFVMCMWY